MRAQLGLSGWSQRRLRALIEQLMKGQSTTWREQRPEMWLDGDAMRIESYSLEMIESRFFIFLNFFKWVINKLDFIIFQ